MNAIKTLILSLSLTLAACVQERPMGSDAGDDGGTYDGGTSDSGGTDTGDGGGERETDLDRDGRPDGIDDPATADGATLLLHQSIAPTGVTITTSVETGAYVYGGGFGGDSEAGEDDWCDTDRPMGYSDGWWGMYLPAGTYLLNAGRHQACESNSLDTWFNLEGEAMASDPWLYRLENGDGYALCISSDGEKLTAGNWSVCNTLDDVSREEREDDGGSDGDGGTDSDGGSSDGGDTGEGCTIRVEVDGDSTVEGYSSYYAEVFILPLDSIGGVLDSTYWPSGDWSVQSTSSLDEALSYSNGGTDSGTFTFSSTVESVKLNGGVWSSSSGSFVRWIVGNYSDSVGASFTVEKSCNGDNYEEMDCAKSGNDYLCN